MLRVSNVVYQIQSSRSSSPHDLPLFNLDDSSLRAISHTATYRRIREGRVNERSARWKEGRRFFGRYFRSIENDSVAVVDTGLSRNRYRRRYNGRPPRAPSLCHAHETKFAFPRSIGAIAKDEDVCRFLDRKLIIPSCLPGVRVSTMIYISPCCDVVRVEITFRLCATNFTRRNPLVKQTFYSYFT